MSRVRVAFTVTRIRLTCILMYCPACYGGTKPVNLVLGDLLRLVLRDWLGSLVEVVGGAAATWARARAAGVTGAAGAAAAGSTPSALPDELGPPASLSSLWSSAPCVS